MFIKWNYKILQAFQLKWDGARNDPTHYNNIKSYRAMKLTISIVHRDVKYAYVTTWTEKIANMPMLERLWSLPAVRINA